MNGKSNSPHMPKSSPLRAMHACYAKCFLEYVQEPTPPPPPPGLLRAYENPLLASLFLHYE